MAKANLPVNFKDDILKENMNGKRRFNMIQNSDGTVSFEDVTEYTQVGSTFGAAQINATNEAVNNAADASKIIDSLETIKANTQSGYIAGALAVKELNSNLGVKSTDATFYQAFENNLVINAVPGRKYCISIITNSPSGNIINTSNISGCTILNKEFNGTDICRDGTSQWYVYRYTPLVIKATTNIITIKGTVTSNLRFFAYVLEI